MKTGAIRTLLCGLMLVAGIGFGGVGWAQEGGDSCRALRTEDGVSFEGRALTSGFGNRNTGIQGASRFHKGIDLRVRDNPMVSSYFGGTVNVTSGSGYGGMVYVTQQNFRVLYAHVNPSAVTVKSGQQIGAGTVLGNWSVLSGTGDAPHLHMEYQVKGPNGEWTQVDPLLAHKLAQGMDPNSPEFAKLALEATQNRCDISLEDLAASTGAGGFVDNLADICDPSIKAQATNLSQAVMTFRQEAMQQIVVPPPAPSMIANTPCFSKELQRVTDTFSSMPQNFMGGMTNGLAGIMGPASGIMNQFFEAGVNSINQAATTVPNMLNFQQHASDALSGLLSGLGASTGFSNELCGMMVDMVVNFLQCQFPLDLPEFPSFDMGGFPSLNDLIPSGCAGDAARKLIYEGAANMPSLGQPASLDNASSVFSLSK